ncbi:hypothetical protein GUJ93_ZPchr0002g26797 [Zizania palustris]|uniref:Myb-like domain-containing protein n=1 Tax=Zizania palustris TaxID=103762 RepID=A0A8J5RZK9_ZIZPA|nr:hypothetical protein GUJ93_ZPchr0002g26797 [Zizania palustris]
MGDGSDGPDVLPEVAAAAAAAGGEIWGTLEELVLACAVSRHGTGSWDSVAMEVQTRSPLAARPSLTPNSCRLRFRQLHRRFSSGDDGAAEEEEEEAAEAEGCPDASAADGWMDELRRLRVADLRRQVERCDLSIGKLQTKVKRLREERERSLHGGEDKTETANGDGDDRLSSDEPGRSCRESNSTDLKTPARPRDHSVKEEDEDEDEEAAAAAKQEASGESAAASKESSDLRSSASLCHRRKPGAAAEDADVDEASAPRAPAQSQPLAALLDIMAIRFGPLLERLHECQESDAYRGTIRRHVDLDMLRGRLDTSAGLGGGGGGCGYYPAAQFFRDVLLLCANALVFFPRGGAEHAAAADARALVNEALRLREPKQESGGAAATVAVAGTASGSAPAEETRRVETGGGGADIVGSLIEKGGKPLIVCRKRSSIAKAAAATRKEENVEKAEAAEEGEGSDDGEKISMAATKDKAWGLRTKKGRGPGKNSGGAAQSRKMAKVPDGTDAAAEAGKGDKKGADAAAGVLAKKRNAVDFLKRLNSSPSKNKASTMGTRKRAAAAATPEHQQKTRKVPVRKEPGGGGSKKGGKTATPKRSVGRPSKRGASTPVTPPPSKRSKVNQSEKPTSAKRGGRRQ